jgi:hypothetical protein
MSRGVTSRAAFERLSRSDQARYPSDLEVRDLARSGMARSPRQAYLKVYGRVPAGRDYRRIERNLGGAFEREGRRLRVTKTDYLWISDQPMPVPTPDGVLDSVPQGTSSRQRSVIGEYWSLVGQSSQLSDAELERKLRPFRRETFRVMDDDSRVVRKGFIIDVQGFREFARSQEGRQERVISPRLSPSDLGATR